MWVRLAIVVSALIFGGCSSVGYLLQAAQGQCDIVYAARPLDRVVEDPDTPERVRALLAEVPEVKRYAVRAGLTPTPSYTEYVALDRPSVVYVVSASEPLRFRPKRWSFPIVGSVPYLGWFERADAEAFAASLAREGWDVDLRGASAYSTLGWFDDPIFSSMIEGGDEARGELVNVILHESVHATLYVPSQSFFNESLASFVADHLTLDYLSIHDGGRALAAYVESEAEGKKRAERLHRAYGELEALYASKLGRADKLAKKAAILRALREELDFARPITNATLTQFKTYHSGAPELEALFAACGASWRRFWKAVRTIGPSSFPAPQTDDLRPVFAPLVRACPS